MDVFEELVRLRSLGQKCALATIVEVRGSIPSYESAKLLVREDGSMAGTIGGGCVEAEVWNAAREVIETEKPKRLTFNLGQDAAYDNGLICGGQLEVFVEPVLPVPHAFIFGAGHISKSLSKVANLAGFATVIVDDRESFANRDRFPEAEAVHAAEYEQAFPALSINAVSYTHLDVYKRQSENKYAMGTPVATFASRWPSGGPALLPACCRKRGRRLDWVKSEKGKVEDCDVALYKLAQAASSSGVSQSFASADSAASAGIRAPLSDRRNAGSLPGSCSGRRSSSRAINSRLLISVLTFMSGHLGRASPGSVSILCRYLLRTVHDYNLNRRLLPLQLQSQLFLHRGKDVYKRQAYWTA